MLLEAGRVAFDGPPAGLTPETLTEIYGAGERDGRKVYAFEATSALLITAALGAMVLVALFALPAYFTGEDAEEAVERLVSAYRTARRLKAQPSVRRLAASLAELGEQADRRLSRRQAEQLSSEGLTRRELDVVRLLAVGRTNPLKNFPLTRSAYMGMAEPRPELWLYGIEPELAASTNQRPSTSTSVLGSAS